MQREPALSTAVLQAIADYEGSDPRAVTPPLYESIDPEALDSLFRETSGEVTFEYKDYTITVGSNGTVEVESLH